MSGLEKFNPRESGLYRLKDFLLRERPAARESLNSSDGSEDSIALDLDQSFAQLIKAHINKRNNMEDKENLYKSACENTLHNVITQKLEQKDAKNETVYSFDDSTMIKDSLSDSDNDSFEELERMCNKTLSDPNNTIHQYLAKYKKSKRSSGVANATTESACLSRLLKEIDEQIEGNGAESGQQIQLNDIEEPSGLWESTFGGDITGLLMTPDRKIKFQPKTPAIIEEATPETGISAETTVDQFFSADETSYLTFQDEKTFVSAKSEKGSLDADEDDQDALSTTLIDLDCTEETENMNEIFSDNIKTVEEDIISDLKKMSVKESDDSVELICLDEEANTTTRQDVESKPASRHTFYVTPRRNTSQRLSQNLIDLDAPTPKVKLEPVRPKIITDINGDSIILLSDEEDSFGDHNDSESHNTAFSLDLEESTNLDLSGMQDLEKKREFNDTLEEVDYIMKQGMKYLSDTNQLPQCLKSYKQEMYSPSPISSPQTPNTVIKKKPVKKLISHEKAKPADHFKKPQAFTKIPQSKHLAATKKPTHFQHIVSPVGAYIKNTPKIPITTEFKPTLNVFQSKAVRGLDYSMKENNSKKTDQPSKEYFSGLPKKAYISSDVKQVVDQRKPATIPGGEKIHRFLHSSKVPAVIRHEGKIKSNIPLHPQSKSGNRADNSLADLSTISGDISLHILKDAKR